MHRISSVCVGIVSVAALATLGAAQVTQKTVYLGGSDAIDCQLGTIPPTLDDGVTQGTATFDYTYDAGTGVLQLDVTNTSPDVPGVPNPLIVHVAFNLPAGAVDSIQLLSQSAAGGATLTFVMAADLDLTTPDTATKMGCLGYFNVGLGDNKPAIANASATTIEAPPGTYAIGPATFVFQLGGPGIGLIDAGIIAAANSVRGAVSGFNAGVKFQSGGAGGLYSGFVSAQQPDCIPVMWITAPAEIGTTIGMCFGASSGCHGCLLVSSTPGPVNFGGYLLPIGLPVLLAIPLPEFTQFAQCYPVAIPDDSTLVGVSLYLTLATANGTIEFSSPAITLTVVN